MKPKILNLEPNEFSIKAIEMLSCCYEYVELDDSQDIKSQLIEASGIITRLGFNLDEEFLHDVKKLKFVATATTGIDHLDVNYLNSIGCTIISLKNEIAFLKQITPTAEHTWGLILSLLRHYQAAFSSVESGVWDRDQFPGTQLHGKTIGIIGLGRLGRMVASYAHAFGMYVVYHDLEKVDDNYKFLGIDELLAVSDVVSIHLPLDDSTKNMIGKEELELMKSQSYLINTSRGGIVNEYDLLKALESSSIKGAAIDVLENEVLWNGIIPEMNELVQYSKNNYNLIITPHLGGACPDIMRKSEEFIVDKIKEWHVKNNV